MVQELPRQPTDSDFAEADRRGVVQLQLVHADYEVAHGLLRPPHGQSYRYVRNYFPLVGSGMLSEVRMLTVGDDEGLCVFARRWGLFGYARVRERVIIAGDPIVWVWAHVRGIQVALELLRARAIEDPAKRADALRVQLASLSVGIVDDEDPANIANELLKRGGYEEAHGRVTSLFASETEPMGLGPHLLYGERERMASSLWSSARTADAVSWSIITHVINANLAGVGPRLNEDENAKPRRIESCDSLVSAMYRHLFLIAAGGDVVMCRDCGTPFERVHRRQTFCPPAFGRESLCAMRFHKRHQRHLARQQKEANNATQA
jgi:hypothetical protein